MYDAYWGLSRRPFENDLAGGFFYASETHRSALLKLRYALDVRLGAALLAGATGSGKSFLTNVLLAQAGPEVTPAAQLLYPRMSAAEWLNWLAGEFCEGNSGGMPIDSALRKIEQRLCELTSRGQRPVIVIDDAHAIDDPEVWQSIQFLLNFQQRADVEFTLLLVGEPTLVTKLARFPQLADRLGVRAILQSLRRQETEQYVLHRLQIAGREKPVFTDGALDLIHEVADGVPRRINRLCDLALLVGYAEQLPAISEDEIAGVADELTLLPAA